MNTASATAVSPVTKSGVTDVFDTANFDLNFDKSDNDSNID